MIDSCNFLQKLSAESLRPGSIKLRDGKIQHSSKLGPLRIKPTDVPAAAIFSWSVCALEYWFSDMPLPHQCRHVRDDALDDRTWHAVVKQTSSCSNQTCMPGHMRHSISIDLGRHMVSSNTVGFCSTPSTHAAGSIPRCDVVNRCTRSEECLKAHLGLTIGARVHLVAVCIMAGS